MLGRRLSKTTGDHKVAWVWDGNTPVHELQTIEKTESPVVSWLFEEGSFSPTAKLVGDKSFDIVTDHLGTPVGMYDSRGMLVWNQELDIWGKVKTGSSTVVTESCPFRFPGQYEDDETGLYYNRFRYFDPEVGGYISVDPIGLAGGNPTLFGYVKDTIRFTDPHGLMPWKCPTESGHHLVYKQKAESIGLDHLGSYETTPTFFFDEDSYKPGDHERIHRAQKPYVGSRQKPWVGTSDEFFDASRKGLGDVDDIKGDLKIPKTGKVLAKNVTPTQAFDRLMKWEKNNNPNKKRKKGCGG